MKNKSTEKRTPGAFPKGGWTALTPFLLFLVALGWHFHQSLAPGQVLFSNDGPLGMLASAAWKMPDLLFSCWQDLNWVGGRQAPLQPNITSLMLGLLGPTAYAKFYAPACLLILGLSGWLLCRTLDLAHPIAILGGLAAMLNGNAFSNAAWGLGSWVLARAMLFLALAALIRAQRESGARRWGWLVLSGFCVGMNVVEGIDTGAILSIYFAAIAAFWILSSASQPQKPAQAGGRVAGHLAITVAAAGLIAIQTVTSLVSTQIVGIEGTEQNQETKEQKWDFATQWSLPPAETLRVAVPGLYGYRMDTENGGNYWGSVGETPNREITGAGIFRFSGSGEYAGWLVLVMAAFALAHAATRSDRLTVVERRAVWFFTGLALVSLLLAFGRYAPFYKLVYALPYFHTIRNPIKFMQPFHICIWFLAVFGLQAFWRGCLAGREASVTETSSWKEWWSRASTWERRWIGGSGVSVGLGLFLCLVKASGQTQLRRYLEAHGFNAEQAAEIVRFSLGEALTAVVLLALLLAVMGWLMSGRLRGAKAPLAACLIGLVATVDFLHANGPWVVYLDSQDKYAHNDLIQHLEKDAHTQRVSVLPFAISQEMSVLQQIYGVDWMQHQFQYYNIQSLDRIQEPRVASENAAYRRALPMNNPATLLRLWQLTNTRLLFGVAGPVVQALNQQLGGGRPIFAEALTFSLAKTQDMESPSVDTSAPGPFALLEYKAALPRASLYTQWQVMPSDEATLQTLPSAQWDPSQVVLLAPGSEVPPATGGPGGSVEFTSYAPKASTLQVHAESPSVLLVNDKHDPDWKVEIDGKPASLLRCNYLMRGVHLPAGDHEVRFTYSISNTALKISLAVIALALCLLGWLLLPRQEPSV